MFEHQNPGGEFYGSDRLRKKLISFKDKSVSDLIDRLFESLIEFGQGMEPRDDISLLGVMHSPTKSVEAGPSGLGYFTRTVSGIFIVCVRHRKNFFSKWLFGIR